MTRNLLLFTALVGSAAWADVGPPPPKCQVPGTCVTCTSEAGDPDAGSGCRAGAADAGLLKQECTDRSGAFTSEYFCPSGTTATRPGCGCAAVDAPLAVALFGLIRLLRRRSAR
ncbi:MAG: hypothetical protein IT380_19960 [Myxococcales bacterium]|nr:hypothetical protein [Myxococcales bacterium]